MQTTLTEVIHKGLAQSRRPEDGLLHCSTDLLGSLRHAQLRIAGAPQLPEPITHTIRMQTGTLWHRYIGQLLEQQGIGVMREVNVTPGLPEGWSGTLDLMSWQAEQSAHKIRDVKTQRSEAFAYQKGVREEHVWQLSAYNMAARNMGYPVLDEMDVCYVPMNAVASHDVDIVEMTCGMLPVDAMLADMKAKREQLAAYLESVKSKDYLTDKLAPVPDRVQALRKTTTKTPGLDVVLVPSWRAAYCRFEPPLCECSLQKQTKIGQYVEIGAGSYMYEPRDGYEIVVPTVVPPEGEVIAV